MSSSGRASSLRTGSVDPYTFTTRIVRQAVERNLEIIGEGLIRLRRVDPATAHRIFHLNRIIGLRNRLAHGYDQEIDDELIWLTSQTSVPELRREIVRILTGP